MIPDEPSITHLVVELVARRIALVPRVLTTVSLACAPDTILPSSTEIPKCALSSPLAANKTPHSSVLAEVVLASIFT